MYETVLNSTKTLKRYCKLNLNLFKIKNSMTKQSFLYDRFFVSNRYFITEHVKLLKIPGFYENFSNFSFFLPKLSNSR